jgi:hypothetical protein
MTKEESRQYLKKRFAWLREVKREEKLTWFEKWLALDLFTDVFQGEEFVKSGRLQGAALHDEIAKRMGCTPAGVKKGLHNLAKTGHLHSRWARGAGLRNVHTAVFKNGDGGSRFSDPLTEKTATAISKNGYSRHEKRLQPSPQIPLKNPLLPFEAKNMDLGKKPAGGTSPDTVIRPRAAFKGDLFENRRRPNPRGDQGTYELVITRAIGQRRMDSMSQERIGDLCDRLRTGSLTEADLLAECLRDDVRPAGAVQQPPGDPQPSNVSPSIAAPSDLAAGAGGAR